jgi:hypothetical protein
LEGLIVALQTKEFIAALVVEFGKVAVVVIMDATVALLGVAEDIATLLLQVETTLALDVIKNN